MSHVLTFQLPYKRMDRPHGLVTCSLYLFSRLCWTSTLGGSIPLQVSRWYWVVARA